MKEKKRKGKKFTLDVVKSIFSESTENIAVFNFDRDKYDFDDIQLLLEVIFECQLKEDIYFFNKIK